MKMGTYNDFYNSDLYDSSIGIGKRQQAQEDGAENAIWRRRKSIKAFLLSKKEEKA